MKNISKQTQMGWCTVHTIQNIFQTNKLEGYLTDERYRGCGEKEVEELLSEIDDTIGVANVLYVNQAYPPLKLDYVWEMLTFKDSCDVKMDIAVIPYLLTVKLIDSCYHSTAVLNVNGQLWYTDPHIQDWIYLESYKDLNNMFKEICCVQRLHIKETKSWAILRGEYWGYDKYNWNL